MKDNKYAVSGVRYDVSSLGTYARPAVSAERGLAKAEAQADYLRSQGYEDIQIRLMDDCANCGHDKRDHFNHSGVCDLGFCSGRCSEYVAPTE